MFLLRTFSTKLVCWPKLRLQSEKKNISEVEDLRLPIFRCMQEKAPQVTFRSPIYKSNHLMKPRGYCWWFRNPVNSPVEVGSLLIYIYMVNIHLFTRFYHHSFGGFLAGFLNHQHPWIRFTTSRPHTPQVYNLRLREGCTDPSACASQSDEWSHKWWVGLGCFTSWTLV